jgi:5'-phosphate synthase pdxT subunit
MPADLDGIGGLVVPGGESTTIGKLADRFGLIDPLRAMIRDGLPTLGTCAGMIFLAGATTETRSQVQLGVLDVVVQRNAFGRQVESFEANVLVRGIEGGPVHAVFIRAPWIEKGHPVVVREGNVYATSFHPELIGDGRIHTLVFATVQEA